VFTMKNIDYIVDNLNLLLWTIFPSIEIFHNIKNDARNISFIEKLLSLAVQKRAITKASEGEFIELLQRCAEAYKAKKQAADFNFDRLVNEIKKDISIKSLVHELAAVADYFHLEKPNEVTFTRLKQDFHPASIKKQHALMILAIWLAANKPELGLNYEGILNFPRHASDSRQEPREGVRMELCFMEPRGNIDPSVMTFLKDALPRCVMHSDINYLNETRITYLATTCVVKIPVKEGFSGFPPTYGEGIRDALTLAYQLMIAWQLTSFYTTSIQFMISIDAGPFDITADSIKDLLHQALPADLPIRLSHFAYMISKQIDIRVIFRETSHPNVWGVAHFWGFPYFKSPPVLMPAQLPDGKESSPLPVRDKDIQPFQDALFLNKTGQSPILDIVRQYPPKVLLALEVAHIATLRRMGHEAVQILSNVLSFEPYNLIALTMRMQNFFNMASCAEDWITSSLLYDRAFSDGIFIEKYCPPTSVFYATFGLLFYSKAVKLIRLMRRGALTTDIENRKREIFTCIEKAEFYNRMGTTVSHNAADSRCAFWVGHYYAFRKLIENNPEFITDGKLPFADPEGIYAREIQYIDLSMGTLNPLLDNRAAVQLRDQRLMLMLGNYLNSISAWSHYTNVLFSQATSLWDFSAAEIKPQILDQVIMFLEMARLKAAALKGMSLGVYISTEIQSPNEFIRSIDRIKNFLAEIRRTEDYANPIKISFMNLDEETSGAPITYDLIQKEEL